MKTPKEWYMLMYGEDKIPAELTWDTLLLAFMTGKAQQYLPDKETQERCLRELSRILRADIDELRRIKENM